MQNEGVDKVERYSSGGLVVGLIGMALALAVLVYGLVDDEAGFAPWAYPFCLLLGLLAYLVLVRPAIRLHRDELEFPWSDSRLVRFVDRRGLRQPVEGSGAGLRQRYLARIATHLSWLDQTCESHGILLERITTDRALAPTFMALLARLAGAPDVAAPHGGPGATR